MTTAKNLNRRGDQFLTQFAQLSFLALSLFGLGLCSLGCSPILKKAQPRPSSSDQASKDERSKTRDANCPILFGKINYCASLTPTSSISVGRNATFELKFWQPTEKTNQKTYSDPGLTPLLWLWMPSMGHGSMDIAVKTTSTPGVFNVEGVAFFMAGDWALHIDLNKNSGEKVDQAVVFYDL
jgi:hypothetical protein